MMMRADVRNSVVQIEDITRFENCIVQYSILRIVELELLNVVIKMDDETTSPRKYSTTTTIIGDGISDNLKLLT